MERKLPKNIRQIGNVSDNPKVYVEDYVDTFISHMCDNTKEGVAGAFLIGESFSKDDQDYIFIHGAVQMKDVEMNGNEIVLGDKSWKKACEEGKKYFAGNTILGWFLTAPELQIKLNNNIIKLHEKLFMRKSRILILKDSLEKEEALFVYKYEDLMHIGGHYIYYEKNPAMQDYMIAMRKQNCVTPSETVEDRATKDFRSVVKNKEEKKKEAKKNKYSYMASTFLVLLLIVMGVASMNNYEKLSEIETAIVQTVASLFNTGESQEVVEANAVEENVDILEAEGEENEVNYTLQEDLAEDSENTSETDIVNVDENDLMTELQEEDIDVAEEAQGDEEVKTDETIYIVQDGDSLAQICRDYYDSIVRVDDVCAANGLEDSDYIYIGQELILPE